MPGSDRLGSSFDFTGWNFLQQRSSSGSDIGALLLAGLVPLSLLARGRRAVYSCNAQTRRVTFRDIYGSSSSSITGVPRSLTPRTLRADENGKGKVRSRGGVPASERASESEQVSLSFSFYSRTPLFRERFTRHTPRHPLRRARFARLPNVPLSRSSTYIRKCVSAQERNR